MGISSLNSETLTQLAQGLDAFAGQLTNQRDTGSAETDKSAAKLFQAAVKVFAALNQNPYGDGVLTGLTPTEACTAAAALLRSQGLTPFEFSIWFSATGASNVGD
jgi:hypothetical protein